MREATWSTVRAFGRREASFGGRTSPAGFAAVRPSSKAKRWNDLTAARLRATEAAAIASSDSGKEATSSRSTPARSALPREARWAKYFDRSDL